MTPEMLATLTEQVAELVQTYSNNYLQFQRATYNETQVRVDFVNRFFKLLGWDVDNERGLPQHLREVTHEATVVVEEDGVHRSKKPDYSFKVGTEVLYFLETKKPAVNLTIDAAPAFQLRRYGWSGNLKVSVLTNFTDLYIYDCSVRPREGDDIGVASSTIVDEDTAKNLYYPNAFSYVAHLSAKENVADRIVSKTTMLSYLSEQRSVLLSKWTLAAMDRSKVLKDKKEYLSGSFAGNTGIRAFVFSDAFLELNKMQILPFLLEYLGKYFKKPKLQQQPIFIFGSGHTALQQSVILGLYQYQKKVNTGMVGSSFVEDTFVNSTDCSPDYVCKIASERDITVNILEKCHVNQFYIVGKARETFNSP